MPSYCQVRLLGHAGKDVELKTTKGGKQLATWSIATGGKDHTQWHNCQAWGEVAKIAAYIHKGDLVELEGTIQTNKYQDKIYTNIVAFRLYLFGARAHKEGDTVKIGGEEYEVVPDNEPVESKLEDIPF